VTNNNRFWIGWLDLLALRLQLQSIITAHNRWLSQTRSIPYWTTSVFSSTVTNDERRITAHLPSWTELTSRRNEYKSTCLTVLRFFCFSVFIRCKGNIITEPLPSDVHISCLFVAAGTCLASRRLAMDLRSGSTIPAFRRRVTILSSNKYIGLPSGTFQSCFVNEYIISWRIICPFI
jgi:hypothetical protein